MKKAAKKVLPAKSDSKTKELKKEVKKALTKSAISVPDKQGSKGPTKDSKAGTKQAVVVQAKMEPQKKFARQDDIEFNLKRCIYGYGMNKGFDSFLLYDLEKMAFAQVYREVHMNSAAAKILLEDKAYAIGSHRKEDEKQLREYKKLMIVEEPRILASMRSARSYTTAIHLCGWIYVVAGRHNEEDLKECEKYSIATDVWVRLPSVNFGGKKFDLCDFNNHLIYKCGPIEWVESFDTLEEEAGWRMSRLARPWTSPSSNMMSVQASNNTVLVFFGGSAELDDRDWRAKYRSYINVYNVKTGVVQYKGRTFHCHDTIPKVYRGFVYAAEDHTVDRLDLRTWTTIAHPTDPYL